MPFYREDYRAVKKDDFISLVYTTFRFSVLENYPLNGLNFTLWLKKNFWKKISKNYDNLKYPLDSSQRNLTSYSYLRCVPYKFFNSYHQERVDRILETLREKEKEIITLYYFQFYKDSVIREMKQTLIPSKIRQEILSQISKKDYLVYVLLLQIERY